MTNTSAPPTLPATTPVRELAVSVKKKPFMITLITFYSEMERVFFFSKIKKKINAPHTIMKDKKPYQTNRK